MGVKAKKTLIPYGVRVHGKVYQVYLRRNESFAEFPVLMAYYETAPGMEFPVNARWHDLIPVEYVPS